MHFAWFPVVRNAELISPSRYAPGLGRLAAWGVGVAVTSLCAVMAGVLMTDFGCHTAVEKNGAAGGSNRLRMGGRGIRDRSRV